MSLFKLARNWCRCTARIHFTPHERTLKVFECRSRAIDHCKALIIIQKWDRLRISATSCSRVINKIRSSKRVYRCLQWSIMHCWPNLDVSNELITSLKFCFGLIYCASQWIFSLMLVICEWNLRMAAILWNIPARWVCVRVTYWDLIDNFAHTIVWSVFNSRL